MDFLQISLSSPRYGKQNFEYPRFGHAGHGTNMPPLNTRCETCHVTDQWRSLDTCCRRSLRPRLVSTTWRGGARLYISREELWREMHGESEKKHGLRGMWVEGGNKERKKNHTPTGIAGKKKKKK